MAGEGTPVYTPEYHPSQPGESAPAAIIRRELGTAGSASDCPVIRVQCSTVKCSCGSPTTIMCSVSGSPTPSVIWIKEGAVCLGPKFRVLQEPPFHYLFIADTNLDAAGEYHIVAKNQHGESSVILQVSVLSPTTPKTSESHPDIPVEELCSVISKFRSNDSLLMKEFFSIEPQWELSQHAGNLPCNEQKNRYCNVFPYDHSRVVLSTTDTDAAGSDYINACHMEEGYIASQGPLPHTFQDFWRMIWEYNIHTIAMMTKISDEHSYHMKCHRYWPKKGSLEEGNFTIVLKDVQYFPYCEIRRLELVYKLEDNCTSRELCHFQFLSWPEYGVPKRATELLEFRKMVRDYRSNVPGPLLVHCSAGVGRTGTFLVIDMLLQRLQQERKVNIFNLVRKLRHRRERTVETPEQYMLIHVALDEAVQSQKL